MFFLSLKDDLYTMFQIIYFLREFDKFAFVLDNVILPSQAKILKVHFDERSWKN